MKPDSNNAKFHMEKLVPLPSAPFYLSCSCPSLFSVATPANCKVVFFFLRTPLHLLSWIQGMLLLGASFPVVLYLWHCPTIVSCFGGAEQQLGLCWCLLSSMLTLNNDVAAALMLHARPNEWERNIFIILKCQVDFTSSWHYLYILLSPPPLLFFFLILP